MSARTRNAAWWALSAALVTAAASRAVVAHHSAAATYAADDRVVVRGRVAGFAWTNPHCHLYVDVTDGTFKGRTFTVEFGSPAAMTSEGWTRTMLKPGDDIVLHVQPARAGTANGLCRRCAVTVNGKPLPPRAFTT